MNLISKPKPHHHLVLDQLFHPVNPLTSYLAVHSQNPTICDQGIRDLGPCLPEHTKGLLVSLFRQLSGSEVQGQVYGDKSEPTKYKQ